LQSVNARGGAATNEAEEEDPEKRAHDQRGTADMRALTFGARQLGEGGMRMNDHFGVTFLQFDRMKMKMKKMKMATLDT
jgi:hypothetical protein